MWCVRVHVVCARPPACTRDLSHMRVFFFYSQVCKTMAIISKLCREERDDVDGQFGLGHLESRKAGRGSSAPNASLQFTAASSVWPATIRWTHVDRKSVVRPPDLFPVDRVPVSNMGPGIGPPRLRAGVLSWVHHSEYTRILPIIRRVGALEDPAASTCP